MSNARLTITATPYGSNGTLTLEAILGDDTIAMDNVEIGEAVARDRFTSQVCDTRPAIPRDQVSDRLLELAKEHLGRKSDAGTTSTPPSDPAKKEIILPEPWVPFPTNQFPPSVETYLNEAGRALQCDPAFVALPLLAAMGAAIGNSSLAIVKKGFVQPPCLWMGIIAPSGDGKSPAQKEALRNTWDKQGKYQQTYNQQMDFYRQAKAEYEEKPKAERDPDKEPMRPVMTSAIISDATCEAIAVRLKDSPRGVLSAVDELPAVFKAMNSYKKSGNDMESWLSFYDAAPAKIDRKTGVIQTIIISHAFVALCGGVQPGVLASLFSDENFDAGLAARFLWAQPPTSRKVFNLDEISEKASKDIDKIFAGLFSIQVNQDLNTGAVKPTILPLTDESRTLFADWFNEVEEERYALSAEETPYSICLPKVRSAAVRIAVVLQMMSYASEETPINNCIEGFNMRRGIELGRWFKREQKRVYDAICVSKEERKVIKLADVIRREFGGMVSVRKWQRKRNHKSAEAADRELFLLVNADLARWQYIPTNKAGHPAKTAVLNDISPSEAVKKASDVSHFDKEVKRDFASSIKNSSDSHDSNTSSPMTYDTCPPAAVKNAADVASDPEKNLNTPDPLEERPDWCTEAGYVLLRELGYEFEDIAMMEMTEAAAIIQVRRRNSLNPTEHDERAAIRTDCQVDQNKK